MGKQTVDGVKYSEKRKLLKKYTQYDWETEVVCVVLEAKELLLTAQRLSSAKKEFICALQVLENEPRIDLRRELTEQGYSRYQEIVKIQDNARRALNDRHNTRVALIAYDKKKKEALGDDYKRVYLRTGNVNKIVKAFKKHLDLAIMKGYPQGVWTTDYMLNNIKIDKGFIEDEEMRYWLLGNTEVMKTFERFGAFQGPNKNIVTADKVRPKSSVDCTGAEYDDAVYVSLLDAISKVQLNLGEVPGGAITHVRDALAPTFQKTLGSYNIVGLSVWLPYTYKHEMSAKDVINYYLRAYKILKAVLPKEWVVDADFEDDLTRLLEYVKQNKVHPLERDFKKYVKQGKNKEISEAQLAEKEVSHNKGIRQCNFQPFPDCIAYTFILKQYDFDELLSLGANFIDIETELAEGRLDRAQYDQLKQDEDAYRAYEQSKIRDKNTYQGNFH